MVQCIASLFLTGAVMVAAAQEKKTDPPKKGELETKELPPPKEPFDTRVKWEQIDPKTGAVAATRENVDALYKNDKWQVRGGARYVFTRPGVGDKITNDKGEVWVVEKAQSGTAGGMSSYMLTASKQEPPKKAAPAKKKP